MTLHTTLSSAPTAADLDAARLLLSRLGVSPADLMAAAPHRVPAPTFAEYIPVVRAAVSARDPPGVRLVLEPDHRALGHPTAGRADPDRRSTNSPSTSRRTWSPAATPAADAAPPNTSSPPCAACTGTPRTTATSPPMTTRPARSPNPDGCPSTRRAVPDTRLAEINHSRRDHRQ